MPPVKKTLLSTKSEPSKAEIIKLRKIIKQANDDYHTKGKPKLSDKQYDAAKDRLETLNPKDPLLKRVGSAPDKRAVKVALPTFMGSLDKIYIDEVDKLKRWLSKYASSTTLASHKLDGISALLTNVKGTLKLYTRGNGSEGSDISHLISHLKGVPKIKEGQQVRGEIVVSKANFKKFSKDYENPRNLATGIANKTKTVHEAAKVGEFLIHEMIKPVAPLPRVAAQLTKLGGKIAPYKIFRGIPTVAQIQKYLEDTVKKNSYEVDGIVLDNGKGERIAIKQVNDVVNVGVKEVKWGISRFGILKPVVHIQPTRIAGVTVTKATGHNAKFIKDNKIGPGAIISVVRSGEVIPKIIGVVEGTKASFPLRTTYQWDGVDIVSTDGSMQDTVEVKKMVNFLTALGIKNFKNNLIAVLYESGLNTVSKLAKAPRIRLEAAGLGPTQAKNLRDSLQSALKVTTMPKMMVASNMFPSGFGNTAAKLIWSELGYNALYLSTVKLTNALAEVNGLGKATIDAFVNGRQAFTKFLLDIKWKPESVSTANKMLAGKVFVFTGVRDAKLQAFLEHNGAEIGSSVTKKTTHLIVRDKSFKSDKVDKARSLNIKVITLADARNLVS